MEREMRPWSELFGDAQDREILAALRAKNWQPETSYSLIKELLNPIIHSVHFNSHSRWGLQIDSQEIRTLALRFLDWMLKKNHWNEVSKKFDADSAATASLRFLLSRYFLRFDQTNKLRSHQASEPSYSARRTMLELPEPQLLMADNIYCAFTSLTSTLPPELRLPYQMHLEGLIDDEIAALMQLEVQELKTRIQNAKAHMKDPNTWKNVS